MNPNPTPAKSANAAPPGPPLGAPLGSGGGAEGFGAGGGGGGGGGPGGKGYGPFVKEATEKIQAALARDDQTAFAGYHVLMTLWRDDSGRLLRCRLARSSGSAELDDRICRITMAIPDLPQNPPDQIGKPVTLSLDAKQVSN